MTSKSIKYVTILARHHSHITYFITNWKHNNIPDFFILFDPTQYTMHISVSVWSVVWTCYPLNSLRRFHAMPSWYSLAMWPPLSQIKHSTLKTLWVFPLVLRNIRSFFLSSICIKDPCQYITFGLGLCCTIWPMPIIISRFTTCSKCNLYLVVMEPCGDRGAGWGTSNWLGPTTVFWMWGLIWEMHQLFVLFDLHVSHTHGSWLAAG